VHEGGAPPGRTLDLRALRAVGSTGSPLPPEAFRWIYDAVGDDLWLASSSGGTDVCTSFLCGCPGEPVRAGELQGPALGVRAAAFDAHGHPVVDRPGELVITEPMPSMPIGFWNDTDGARYRDSYFSTWPGVWRHGDRVTFTDHGGAVIHGRSDATLNRGGVRIGTGEIYRVVEAIPAVRDSLAIGGTAPDGEYRIRLFVALADGHVFDDALRARIRAELRRRASPRHLPDEIVHAPAIPRTHNGKKLEIPVTRILAGEAPESVAEPSTLADPASLDFYRDLARREAGPVRAESAR
jgi:acetoacetyl-CoA synthetase